MIRTTALLVLLAVLGARSSRIVGVFPVPSKSHHILGSALLKELASRGHEVIMISPYPLSKPFKNYKDVDLSAVLRSFEEKRKEFTNQNFDNMATVTKFWNMMSVFSDLNLEVVSNKNLHAFVDSKPQVDLVIHMPLLSDSLLGIGHKLNATTILFSPVGTNFMLDYYTGNPAPYSYVPNILINYTDDMTYIERFVNAISNLALTLSFHFINIPYQNDLLQKYFPGSPHISELIDNIDLALVNAHFTTESARPYLPNMIRIGGFQLQRKQTPPKEVELFLNNSKHGVVYFSLGTNLRSCELPQTTIDTILKVFSKSKYDVLWKYEEDLPNKPKNVLTNKWLPQLAILSHPKVKAFINHGGLGSIVESTFHGVPMICSPFFGDHGTNCAEVVSNHYGIHLNIKTVNESVLSDALREIIEKPLYRDKIKVRSQLLKNQEMNPMDKAVYWIEHVIMHKGAKHLVGKANKIPWYQYLLLDIVIVILCVLILILFVVYLVLRKLYELCFKERKIVKQKAL